MDERETEREREFVQGPRDIYTQFLNPNELGSRVSKRFLLRKSLLLIIIIIIIFSFLH